MDEMDQAARNPYAAPEARVADARIATQLELAGRGERLAAKIVDGLAYGLGYVPLLVLLVQPDPAAALLGLSGLALLAVVVVNAVLIERHDQTIGKKLLGLRMRRTDGERVGLARTFLVRFLPVTIGSAIPFVGWLVGLVDALMIFRDDRRCLHDVIADTIVVKA